MLKGTTVKGHYSAAVIFDAQNNVLLCKRGADKKVAPNMWHLPGGTIELDETPRETIERELQEELGLKSKTILPTNVIISFTVNGSTHQTQVFFVEALNSPTIMNAENSEFTFVPIAEFASYLEPHFVEDNVRAANAALAVRSGKTI